MTPYMIPFKHIIIIRMTIHMYFCKDYCMIRFSKNSKNWAWFHLRKNGPNSEEKEWKSSDREDLMDLLFHYHVGDAFEPAENEKRQWLEAKADSIWLNWAEHFRKLQHEQAFDSTYWMLLKPIDRLAKNTRYDLQKIHWNWASFRLRTRACFKG